MSNPSIFCTYVSTFIGDLELVVVFYCFIKEPDLIYKGSLYEKASEPRPDIENFELMFLLLYNTI